MKIFQSDYNKNHLYFANHERIDENILFDNVVNVLKSKKSIIICEKQIGPSEDYYKCKINGKPFILFYDIDDGPFIHTDDKEAMEELIELFQE